jgi:outer membrane protein OmpA-like peptidoglycan-associated protein
MDCRVTTSAAAPTEIQLRYLCDHDLATDAQTLLAEEIRARFADATASVNFERITSSFEPLVFARNQATLNAAATATSDRAGQLLQRHPHLRVEVTASRDAAEPEAIAVQRARAVADYLTVKWQVAAERITTNVNTDATRTAKLILKVKEG